MIAVRKSRRKRTPPSRTPTVKEPKKSPAFNGSLNNRRNKKRPITLPERA